MSGKFDSAWKQAQVIEGKNPDYWRFDKFRNVIKYGAYGTRQKYGWEFTLDDAGRSTPMFWKMRSSLRIRKESNKHRSIIASCDSNAALLSLYRNSDSSYGVETIVANGEITTTWYNDRSKNRAIGEFVALCKRYVEEEIILGK